MYKKDLKETFKKSHFLLGIIIWLNFEVTTLYNKIYFDCYLIFMSISNNIKTFQVFLFR